MQANERDAWLRLTLTPGVGPTQARRLLAAFGPPQALFDASYASLNAVVGPTLALALTQEPAGWRAQCDATAAWLADDDPSGVRRLVLTLADAAYPQALLSLSDPPPVLYLTGTLGFEPNSALAQVEPASKALYSIATVGAPEHLLAIVGSRSPTAQGRDNAHAFARHLAEQGWTVVSGLAAGVDGAAHEGALLAADRPACTVAVVGTGLDRVYPRSHRELAHAIAQRGALLSELPLGTPPLAGNFPRRNRLIAALARGVLVVEAALRSGSLITARLANELGREVFAIPGSIHNAQTKGCHALIKQGAKLVESAQDILDELGPLASVCPPAVPASPAPIDRTQAAAPGVAVLAALGWDAASLDVLQARTGWATEALQTQLSLLEIMGQVVRLPGGLFQRVSQAE